MAPQVTIMMGADDAKAIQALVKVAAANDKLLEKLDKTNDAAKKAQKSVEGVGDSGTDAFGKMEGAIVAAVGKMAVIKEVIDKSVQALRFMGDEMDAMKSRQDALTDPRRKLRQLAGPGFPVLEEQANWLASRKDTGLSRAEAMNLVFSAHSENFVQDAELLARFNPIMGTEDSTKIAGQVRDLFKDSSGNRKYSAIEALSGVLKAAQESRLDAGTLSNATPKAAAGMKLQGAGFEETLAALSVFASQYSSPEEAATALSGMAGKLSGMEGVQGIGLSAAVSKLSAMPEADRTKLMGGDNELRKTFSIYAEQLPLIQERQKQIEQAVKEANTPMGLVNQKIATLDDTERARLAIIGATNDSQIIEERQNLKDQLQRDASIAQQRAAFRDAPPGTIQERDAQMERMVSGFVKSWTGYDPGDWLIPAARMNTGMLEAFHEDGARGSYTDPDAPDNFSFGLQSSYWYRNMIKREQTPMRRNPFVGTMPSDPGSQQVIDTIMRRLNNTPTTLLAKPDVDK